MWAIQTTDRTDILVVGFDDTDDGIKSVERGKLAATGAQQPDKIDAIGGEIADKVIKGEKISPSIPVKLKLISK